MGDAKWQETFDGYERRTHEGETVIVMHVYYVGILEKGWSVSAVFQQTAGAHRRGRAKTFRAAKAAAERAAPHVLAGARRAGR